MKLLPDRLVTRADNALDNYLHGRHENGLGRIESLWRTIKWEFTGRWG